MKLFEIVQPIRLLRGSHKDTGYTGSGCFMNVISYLEGDRIITDRPGGVDERIRGIAVFANDYMNDGERQHMMPFVFRAMGTRDSSAVVMSRRLRAIYGFLAGLQIQANQWFNGVAGTRPLHVPPFNDFFDGDIIDGIISIMQNFGYNCDLHFMTRTLSEPVWMNEMTMPGAIRMDGPQQRHHWFVARLLGLLDDICPPDETEQADAIERAKQLVERSRKPIEVPAEFRRNEAMVPF